MLDYFSKQILIKISELCPDNNYQVVEAESFNECFDGQVVIDGLNKALKKLRVLGLISLRYDRDGEFCLCITDKGRSLILGEKLEKLTRSKRSSFLNCFLLKFIYFILSFFASLLALFVFNWLTNA